MGKKQIWLWLVALALGVGLGFVHSQGLAAVMDFIATVFTRLFRLLAVPTIVLAVITTLASLKGGGEVGRMFRHTLSNTLLTTFAAAALALGFYLLVRPGSIPASALHAENPVARQAQEFSYSDHLLSIIPDNVVRPLLDGNVLALLLMCFAAGIAISRMPESEPRKTLVNLLNATQDLLYKLIRWLIAILPIGIVAFAAQMVREVGGGVVAESLGKYILVILAGNLTQIFIVLPLFLLGRGLNPLKCMRAMSPALIMAFFTKSSAATLPVTIDCAENKMRVPPKVARFVLPICTTVNMNGCAAFILVTSLFVMQNNAMPLTWVTMLVWLGISVLSAVGNAGVPMGCYFLTLSLMSGIGADISVMGIILPIYTVIDMVETAENVWSDSCVAAMTARKLAPRDPNRMGV